MGEYVYISTIGQDSHAFAETGEGPIKLCGVDIPFDRAFRANSDGDVALHAITNAISGYTGINILGGAADVLCLEQGIKDSTVYLAEALKSMNGAEIIHCSMTIECLRPKLKEYIPAMKEKTAELLGIPASSVGITATTGEGLTGFGKGEGVQVFAILSIRKPL
ncbi:MAG: 2-C-methyl-D-erythritol 2,4-cyclodiphosphate synthase [Saccharofermentans sp.]|jgi:2-C-methyl-D-erythritol 2,4-cyclodiphosphate synthase|nr:2-C-methyl-D-erythritol 2,4-cyclodiphosphate synthase [Saccharofermentans sp.]